MPEGDRGRPNEPFQSSPEPLAARMRPRTLEEFLARITCWLPGARSGTDLPRRHRVMHFLGTAGLRQDDAGLHIARHGAPTEPSGRD
jgi:hypothetical protein